MEWNEYKIAFIEAARKSGKNNAYCEKYLNYAEQLWMHHMPVIYTQEHLCALLGYLPTYVYAAANAPEDFYRQFLIPKKNGGSRMISEPLPNLKEIQEWILKNILYKAEISTYAKAYIPGKSVKDNVRFHRRQKKVLSLDIKAFYDHLTDWMVFQFFIEKGYNEAVAMMLTGLCCLRGCLPQGAPTSAALSNLLMVEFDEKVGLFCKEKKIRYTRYADDMTFSGDFDELEVIRFVRQELKSIGLRLNMKKTRTRKQGQQQEVTGIVVNYKTQLPKSIRKEIRKNMYYIQKFGLESHLEYIGLECRNYREHLLGQIGYALFINPKDQEMKRYKEIIHDVDICCKKQTPDRFV
ncbi:reverse transcriptase family protein [Jingyaoa shaoxingensis]|uniref:RNA-directed DNA polymerase n=1 Tax=Jingyaoa shaoxingensis TaxID=2763671 RepID=A0ABR7NE21_9FIRM|nr:reverse transcriptase family protein [Jingyaoa shaoxingensis]MBC8574661.1 RNA-directed DNA polymerase [Jingyaoa shaoxingensis]